MPCHTKHRKKTSYRYRYHGSVGKYATLEKLMEGNKSILIKKSEKGYYDIYQLPKSKSKFIK